MKILGGLILICALSGCGAHFEEIRSASTLAEALARSRLQIAEPPTAPAAPTAVPSRVWSQATGQSNAPKVTGQLFVRFTPPAAAAVERLRQGRGRPHVGIASLDQLLDTYGVTRIAPIFTSLASNDVYLLDLTTHYDRADLLRAFNDDPSIVYAEPNDLPERPLAFSR